MNKKVTFPIWIFISIAGILVVTGIAWGLISRANERKTQEATISTIIETTAAEKTTEPATPTPTQEPTATAMVTETTPETTIAETTPAPTVSPTPGPATPKPTKEPTVSPTPKPATATPTPTAPAEAWMEAKGTSSLYDGAMQERADNGYESIPRSATLDALAQGRAEELALLGAINHDNMPNEANWEGLMSGSAPSGAWLYAHCGDSFAATQIGIGRASYHRADGSTYSVTCMLLKE